MESVRQELPPPSRSASGVRLDLPPADLDAVVAKSLAVDPRERYRSADRLADDLLHLLEGRPVLARRSNRLYQLRRFVGRHRLQAPSPRP